MIGSEGVTSGEAKALTLGGGVTSTGGVGDDFSLASTTPVFVFSSHYPLLPVLQDALALLSATPHGFFVKPSTLRIRQVKVFSQLVSASFSGPGQTPAVKGSLGEGRLSMSKLLTSQQAGEVS